MTGVARRPVAERLRQWLIARCAPISIDGQTVEAITIDGQDVTEVTMDGDTVFSNPATPDSVVENWEDGDKTVFRDNWTGWNGDTGQLDIQQSTTLEGSFTADYTTSNGSLNVCEIDRDTADTPSEVSMLIQVNNKNGSDRDNISLRVESGGSDIFEMELEMNNDIDFNGNGQSESWSLDTTYRYRAFNIDYANNELDFELNRVSDGTTISSATNIGFYNSTSDVDRIQLLNDSRDGGTVGAYIDNIRWA